MAGVNFLANYQPKPVDVVDSLGRGLQLGRSIGTIPYQNALMTNQMEELERTKQARNAMSEYGTTGDIQPLMKVNPAAAFDLQDKQAALELKKAGISEKNMKLGIDAIVKLGPMINEQNYGQIKSSVDKLFGSNVMPDVFDPQAIARVAAFANRASKNAGLMNLAPGAVAFDPITQRPIYQNPLQAKPMTPYEAGRLALDREKLDRDVTVVPGEIDDETGLPRVPTETYTGKVKFRPNKKTDAQTPVPVMTEDEARAAGTVPKGTRIIKKNDPDYAPSWAQAVQLVNSDLNLANGTEEQKIAAATRLAKQLYAERISGRPAAGGKAPAGTAQITQGSAPPPAMLKEGFKRAVTNPTTGTVEYWTLKNGQAVRVK